jgi:hypothetical protein
VEIPVSREVYKCVYTKVKSVYIVSKLVCILLAKWCVGIENPHVLVLRLQPSGYNPSTTKLESPLSLALLVGKSIPSQKVLQR